MKVKQKSIILTFLIVCVFALIGRADFVLAGGWDMSGTNTTGGYAGSGDCNKNGADRWAASCERAGVSWAFYKTLKSTNSWITLPYPDDEVKVDHALDKDGDPLSISPECSKHGNDGGFFSFGNNSVGAGYYDTWGWASGGRGDLTTTKYYGVTLFYGHWAPLAWPGNFGKTKYYNTGINNGTPKQRIEDVYEFDKAYSYETVLARYNDYLRSEGRRTVSELPNGLAAFCWWPDMAGSTFQGDSAVLEIPNGDNTTEWGAVPDNKKKNTDWQDTNKLDTSAYIVNDCDLNDGCWVSFRHYLKRTGSGSTKYFIERDYGDDTGWTTWNFKTDKGENVASELVKMYPGQKLCETMHFYTKSDSSGKVSNEVKTKICAVAVATEGSDISVQIRDQESSDEYKNWRNDEVYAKPGDNVELKGTYTPYYQPMYNTEISESFAVNNFAESGKSIGQAFDANINPGWKNAFSIKVGGQCGDAINGNIGSNNEYPGERSYRVQGSDAGESNIKNGNAMTNCSNNVKNTPNSVGLTYSDGNGFDVNVDISSKLSNDVKIKVPYNFQNSTDIKLDGKTIYAGESATVSYDVIVGARDNRATDGIYATPVPNASWGLEMKIGNGDWLPVSDSGGNGNLNSPTENGGIGYSPDGNREQKGRNVSIPVPDVPAGTEVCFRSWVSPSLSGANKNLSESGFDKKPAWDEDCTKIAKKPSFQVWGGGIYSAGNLNLEKTLANKITLDGYGSGMYVFGSWAELSLVAEEKVTGLASGAGLGYGETTDADNAKKENENMSGLGGSNNDNYDNYCSISTLSIANSGCNDIDTGTGNLGRSSGRSGDKSSLISDFVQEGDQFNIEEEFSLSGVDDNRKTDKGVYYYDGKDKDLSIFESAIGAGATKVVRTNNDIAILGNIVYQNEGYSNLESIPKIIIYAENINISCSVTRIDAVLIADKNINTCDGKENNKDVNLKARSKQLVINGSVISNTLTLGRTYGAATGKNSVIPAEIINYDTSLYLWANNQSEATTSGKLTETYINELAPRY